MDQTTPGIGHTRTLPTTDLNLYHKNPRMGDVDAIAGSLQAHGQFRPIVVNEGTHTGRPMETLAGNHTLKAIRQLAEQNPTDPRWAQVEAYVIDVDEDRAARIVLADNRTAELGSYDDELLLDLLTTVDYDLDGTGYDDDDISKLLDTMDQEDGTGDYEEETDLEPPADPISKPGDIWELGPHRLLIGDATDTAAVENMMQGEHADCVWTDPPYGVSYVGKTKDALTIQNDGEEDVTPLLLGAFTTAIECAHPGAPVYSCSPQGPLIHEFQQAFTDAGLLWRQNLIWVKNTIALGRSDYHYRHEPILYGFTPDGEGRLGRGGERWYGDDAQSTVFEVDRPIRNGDHPTMKPPELILRMLQNSCKRGGIVLDPFAGSGSTMVAAHQRGARARLVELDPQYGDVICRRYEELTGDTPIHYESGEAVTFLGGEA